MGAPLLICLACAAMFALTACGGTERKPPADARPTDIVAELRALAFVPKGRTSVPAGLLSVGTTEALLVDRFEVSWAMLDALQPLAGVTIPDVFRPEARLRNPEALPSAWLVDTPAVGMTMDEAELVAAARGLRLPTFEEWLWCATGPYARRYPSGKDQRSLANTSETNIFSTRPVGSFESGRTPDTGLYDMVGNVWEWVRVESEELQTLWSVQNVSAWPLGGWRRLEGRCVGGSFASPSSPVFTRDGDVFAQALTRGHRGIDLGLRCAATASLYLSARADLKLTSPERTALRAVGKRWGPRAIPLLDRLTKDHPDSGLISALLAGARR